MSDPIAKRERSLAKDARQSLAPDVGVGRRVKPNKTVVVEYRASEEVLANWPEKPHRYFEMLNGPKDWARYKAYRSIGAAQQFVDSRKPKFRSLWQFRIKPEVTQEKA